MKNLISIKQNLDSLKLSDVYSLMLFILYRTKDIPEYSVLSELCYLLDSNSLIRLLTYFSGETIKIPTADELTILINALLLYQYIQFDNLSFTEAQNKLDRGLTAKQKDTITTLYLKIIPIIENYNLKRSKIDKNAR